MDVLNTALGFLLCFTIGASCRYYALPLPAPPNLLGATLVLCITLGYLVGQLVD